MDSTITAVSILPTASTPSLYLPMKKKNNTHIIHISLHQTQLSAESCQQCSSHLHLIAHHI